MNIGTLTGAIVLDDRMSSVLMNIDKSLLKLAETSTTTSAKLQQNMTMAASVGSFLGTTLAGLARDALLFGKNLVTGSLMAGARLEQLTGVTQFLGERAGYTAQEVDTLSAKIEKTGITGVQSREAIQKLLSAHIDLARASELSAMAQSVASIKGRSSSETFGVLTNAITTLNSQQLRGLGLTTSMSSAMTKYTEETGKSADGLSMRAKQQLLLTALLKEGIEYDGLYAKSMEYASKQAGSAERAWGQVSEQIGLVFLPVTSTAIKAWYQLGSSVRDAVKDMQGDVGPIMTSVAGYLKTLIERTGELATASMKSVTIVKEAWSGLPEVVRLLTINVGLSVIAFKALNAQLLPFMARQIWLFVDGFTTRMGLLALKAQETWALIAAHPLVAVTAALGAITLAVSAYVEANAKAALRAQEAGAGQDVINRALEMGAEKGIKFAQAQEFILQKLRELHPERFKAADAAKAAAEAETQATAASEEFTKKVMERVAAVATANEEQTIANAVWEKSNTLLRLTIESQGIYIPMLEKMVASGRALTKEQTDYVNVVAASRVNAENYQASLLRVNDVTLKQIEALRAYGLSEQEIATRLNTTVGAMKKYESQMSQMEAATRRLADLKANLDATEAERAIIQHNREYEDAVRSLDMTLAANRQYAEKLREIRDESNRQEKLNIATIQAANVRTLQERVEIERNTLYEMLLNGRTLRTEIEKQKAVLAAAEAAARGYTSALTEGATRAGEAVDKTTEKINKSISAMAQMPSSSYDVTSQNFESTIRTLQKRKGPSGNVGLQEATDLAEQGYSLEEILQIVSNRMKGARGPIPPPRGPAIPGMVPVSRPTVASSPTVSASAPAPAVSAASAAGLSITNTFHVNGTAEETAVKIGAILMRDVKAGRQFGTGMRA